MSTAFAGPAELVEGTGITLVVEAINNVHVPGYFWDEVGVALAVCRAVDHPRVRLAFDCYHQQLSGGRLTDNLVEALPWMARFDVADVPGRGRPGAGEINYPYLRGVLESRGYDGLVSFEMVPPGRRQRPGGPGLPADLRVLNAPIRQPRAGRVRAVRRIGAQMLEDILVSTRRRIADLADEPGARARRDGGRDFEAALGAGGLGGDRGGQETLALAGGVGGGARSGSPGPDLRAGRSGGGLGADRARSLRGL